MTNPSGKPTLEEETIIEMARRARMLHICTRALSWTVLPCLFGITFAVITSVAQHQHAGASLFWKMLLPTFPLLSVCIWIAVEAVRTKSVCSKFSDVFTTGRSDALSGVSSSAIGPLLDMLMPGAINADFLPRQVALLGDLLKSVREEEDVFLTADQRNQLHELVIVGRWHWFNLHDDRQLGEDERRAVRPSAISALAVLGNRASIPVLERFARKTDDPELHASALHSLEQIRERLQYGPEQMLRASTAPERPDTLLRAFSADKPQSRDPQQLLRADNTDAELQDESAVHQTGGQATPDPNSITYQATQPQTQSLHVGNNSTA
jgi:hypothetical protein